MACVYFVLDLPEEDPTPTAAFVKALPVLSLAWLVCLHGVRYGNAPSTYVNYNRRILYGLLFSIAGDVLLVWQHYHMYFMLGMICFACTQVCYILAFGFTPFGFKEFIPALAGLIAALSIVYPCVSDGFMAYLVPLYATLLAIMGWRSLACFTLNGEIPWKKILSAIGACLFVISDTFIGINKFCYPVPFERTIIMSTYYAAQLCISLSVINFHLSGSGLEQAGGQAGGVQVEMHQMPRPSGPDDEPRSTTPPRLGSPSKPEAPGADGMRLSMNKSDPNTMSKASKADMSTSSVRSRAGALKRNIKSESAVNTRTGTWQFHPSTMSKENNSSIRQRMSTSS
jgi:uncharacterized membrane protein YhhN